MFYFQDERYQNILETVGMSKHNNLLSYLQIFLQDISWHISILIRQQNIPMDNQFNIYLSTNQQMFPLDNFKHKLCHFDERKAQEHLDIGEHTFL